MRVMALKQINPATFFACECANFRTDSALTNVTIVTTTTTAFNKQYGNSVQLEMLKYTCYDRSIDSIEIQKW